MKNELPPGIYEAKMVGEPVIKHDPKTGEATLISTLKIPALGDGDVKVAISSLKLTPGDMLSKDDIERLARVAWENTGKEDLPVLPPGQVWMEVQSKKRISPEELVTAWDQVTTKDIFRRQAAAVAKALGFKLADDVQIKPRSLPQSDDDFSIERFISRDLLPVEVRRIGDGRRALALPEPKTKEEMKSQLEILHDGVRALQSLDDLGIEANRRVFTAMDKIMAKAKRLEKELGE